MIRSNKQSSVNQLPVLGEDETSEASVDLVTKEKNSNSNRSSSRLSNPGSRRTPTPTKQILLPGVRRKEERVDETEKIDFEELNNSLSRENSEIFTNDFPGRKGAGNSINKSLPRQNFGDDVQSSQPVQTAVGSHPVYSLSKPSEQSSGKETVDKKDDEESSDDSDNESDEEPRKAPNELFMEFLDCLMKKEYATAAKLCKMILIFEPEHPEALKFMPVLEEKIKLDEEKANESDENESGDEESDDSGEEDDDSDDSDDDDSDEDEDNDEEEGGNQNDSFDEFFNESKYDSGIVSASSD